MDRITVAAPATVSNVNCGFDCLGFALSEPFDLVTVQRSSTPGIRIKHLDDFGLPEDPTRNVAGVALSSLIDAFGENVGFDVEITKQIKPGSGLGSSAASSAGAVFAANELLGRPFSNTRLVEFAMDGEAVASGARHADNVAPCIFGGFSLVRSIDPLEIVLLSFPELHVAVLHPQIEIKTSEARGMLPREIPLTAAARQWSNLAAMIAALAQGDFDLLSRSMVDEIVEPVRKRLLPFFDDVKGAALRSGALGCGISGSGPSIFAICASPDISRAVEGEIRRVFSPTQIPYNTYVSAIDKRGVRAV